VNFLLVHAAKMLPAGLKKHVCNHRFFFIFFKKCT
jgi:hypothetical protein